jgi:UDP-N-acetylmuramate--alanine ligase
MGIGGVSMQALARWYHAEGFRVSGCDSHPSAAVDALRTLGIDVYIGHHEEHIGADVSELVITMAVPASHPEIARAHALGVRVRPRMEVLAELFELRRAIGVTGTHGKSTTSGMIAALLLAAGVDPSIQLGASLPGLDGNMRHGAGPFLVAEVDESDPGFAALHAEVAVLTNLEDDHIAGDYDERRNYHATLEDLQAAARRYALQAPRAIYCADWPGLRELLAEHPQALSFGLHPDADARIEELVLGERSSRFSLTLPDGGRCAVEVGVPGLHNALNAAAALLGVAALGLDAAGLAPALAAFTGVGRRWQVWGEQDGALIVDDYAHHPTEVEATLVAARATGRRVRAILQPHRWIRTARMWPALADAAGLADEILVLDVYAAGETPIAGIHAGLIVERLRSMGRTASHHSIQSASDYLRATRRTGDLIITLGAGDVWRVAQQVAQGASR